MCGFLCRLVGVIHFCEYSFILVASFHQCCYSRLAKVLQRCQHQLLVAGGLPALRIALHAAAARIARQRVAAFPTTTFTQLGQLFLQQLVVLSYEADQVFRHLVRFPRDSALLATLHDHRHFLAIDAQGYRGDAVCLVALALAAFPFCWCGHAKRPHFDE